MRPRRLVMSKIKYLKSVRLKCGSTKWEVSPPNYVKAAINAKYRRFDNHVDATEYAIHVSEAYVDHRRGIERKQYIEDDTVAALVNAYKGTNSWTQLSGNSKRTYDQLLRCVQNLRVGEARKPFQTMRVCNIDVSYAEALYQQLTKDVSMHRANHTCKVLRRVWTVGDRLGMVKANPFRNMGLKKTPARTVLWEQDQVQDFIDTADNMDLPSLGTMALMCYDLCQRPGDMRKMTWNKFRDQMFGFEQEKNKTWVDIPASPRLIDRLNNAKISNSHDCIVYYERTGKPYDRRQYNKVFCRIREAAKLPSILQMRDLRRTGATEMAEAGCTEDELRSVTGHQSRDVLSIYVRPTRKLAAAGINKRFG